MQHRVINTIGRRSFLASAGAASILALSACATDGFGRLSLVEVIRRLLEHASRNALARLAAPGGFYDNQMARLNLPEVFGSRGGVLQNILTSVILKDRLNRALNHLAEDGARQAAPVIAEAVRTVGVANAEALLRGGPSAATGYLRSAMGGRLIETMVPVLGEGMRLSSDPVVSQAIAALTGVDVAAAARSLSDQADNAIWGEIGREEAAIRANPESTNDALLIAALKGAAAH